VSFWPSQPPFPTPQPASLAHAVPWLRQAAGALGVSAPALAWGHEKGPRGNCSEAPPRAEKKFKKREGEKSQTAAVVLREALRDGLIQEAWNSKEKSHWLEKKNPKKFTAPFQSSVDMCRCNT